MTSHRTMARGLVVAGLLWATSGLLSAQAGQQEGLRPGRSQTVTIFSSLDRARQSIIVYVPENSIGPGSKPVPLLVALHSWSGGYTEAPAHYYTPAKEHAWAMVAPHYRGSNYTPQAGASDKAIQDVLDAVAFVQKNASIDPDRIYLIGQGGGGHMALMLAAKRPDLWGGVSVWGAISDLEKWHAFLGTGGRFGAMLEGVCGGPPNEKTRKEYTARSPLTFLDKAKGVPIDLNVGIRDGADKDKNPVPPEQTLLAFNMLCVANDQQVQQLSEEDVATLNAKAKVPDTLQQEFDEKKDTLGIEAGRKQTVLYRRLAGPVRLTVFDGGADEDVAMATAYLKAQSRAAAATAPSDDPDSGVSGGATEQTPTPTSLPASVSKDWAKLFTDEDWYRDMPGEEKVFTGKLEAIRHEGEVSTLMRPMYYTLAGRSVYTAGKQVKALDDLVGFEVEVRGKPYDLDLEGQKLREIWPSAVRPKPQK